jgi:hypothetical protein
MIINSLGLGQVPKATGRAQRASHKHPLRHRSNPLSASPNRNALAPYPRWARPRLQPAAFIEFKSGKILFGRLSPYCIHIWFRLKNEANQGLQGIGSQSLSLSFGPELDIETRSSMNSIHGIMDFAAESNPSCVNYEVMAIGIGP